MRFGILGPIEVWDGEQRLVLGGPQQRALLAALLLNANHVVSTDRLIDFLWGEAPPATARSLLQGCVAQLRRSLRPGDGQAGQPLATRAPGYLLQVGPGELDRDRFDELTAAASRALAESPADLERAGELLREALSLWRGPALGDVPAAAMSAEAASLAERRLAALDDRIDIDLRLGRYAALVAELRELVRAYPLRERIWTQLMLALYGTGRQADALAAYQELRQNLVEQLGVEPGASVRQLQRAILSGADPLETHLQARRGPGEGPGQPPPAGDQQPITRPAQLPAATGAFTGRVRHLKWLDELLSAAPEGAAVGVVSGTAGIGKTALAVHWAHRVREQFADGQLYVNLRGYAQAPPMPPIEALAGFLLALGVRADRVPVDLEPAAALYRTLLAGKRMLVLLDNARSAEQVRPLLPGGSGCLALVTGRDQLAGLVVSDGAAHLSLDLLEPDEANALLGRLLGRERVEAEPAATAALASACVGLPLALRITAANLAVHPRRRIADQVAELTTGDRLAALEVHGDAHSAVRAAFDLSYVALKPDAQRLFRLLGLVPGPEVTAGAAAALTGAPSERSARLLERLAGTHLLDQPALGRYAFHDLLRLYAAERAEREDTDEERDAATSRLLDWYLRSADVAARLLYPERTRLPVPSPGGQSATPVATLDDHTQALAWLDSERPNLVAAVQHAAERGPRAAAWLLADTLHGYLYLRRHTLDWLVVSEAGLVAAEGEGNLAGQAALQLSLGDLHERLGDHPQATAHDTRALMLSRQAGWLEGQAVALAYLGILHRRAGRMPDAAEHYRQALELDRQAGWLPGIAARLGSLGNIDAELGRLEQAAQHFAQALATYQQIGSRGGEANQFGNLGECAFMLGRLDEAIDCLTRALALNRAIGHRGLEADNLRALAEAHRDAGRHAEALELAEAALALARETGDRRYEANARDALGTVYQCLGRFGDAAGQHQQVLQLAQQTGLRQLEVNALIGLAAAHLRLDQPGHALSCAERAVTMARRHGYRLLEGPALAGLATVYFSQDKPDEASGYAQQAIDSHRATGSRLGEGRARLLLGRALDRRGDTAAAVAHWRQAFAQLAGAGAPEADEARSLLRHAGVDEVAAAD
jgi:DNA-binding SARP family transcriptional activator/Tfp pilus assembly protein PilF